MACARWKAVECFRSGEQESSNEADNDKSSKEIKKPRSSKKTAGKENVVNGFNSNGLKFRSQKKIKAKKRGSGRSSQFRFFLDFSDSCWIFFQIFLDFSNYFFP